MGGPMIIEIKGVQFVNKGAELMLYAIREQLIAQFGDVKIVLRSNKNSPYSKRSIFGAYQKLELDKFSFLASLLSKKLRRQLMDKWGVVTDADVDVVLDASGFAYGDQWGATKNKKLLKEIKRAKRFSQKFIFMPQAFGPFNRDKYLEEFRRALVLADLVCAREPYSHAGLEPLMNGAGVLKEYPDFTNLCSGVIPADHITSEGKILIIPNSNMTSSKNNNKDWSSAYVRVLMDSISVIEQLGYIPAVLNHEGVADAKICRELVASYKGGSLEVISEDDPLRVKGIIGQSAGVICSRFHGCVSALSQGVPCLGTSWSHKYEQLFKAYQCESSLLTPDSNVDVIKEKLTAILNTSVSQVAEQKCVIEAQKAMSRQMWKDVFQVIALD
jgi:polysaccharide pyruvyl transferase WcaK-like protein